jgi:hypothetical protein
VRRRFRLPDESALLAQLTRELKKVRRNQSVGLIVAMPKALMEPARPEQMAAGVLQTAEAISTSALPSASWFSLGDGSLGVIVVESNIVHRLITVADQLQAVARRLQAEQHAFTFVFGIAVQEKKTNAATLMSRARAAIERAAVLGTDRYIMSEQVAGGQRQ